jgi:hypothetical protein
MENNRLNSTVDQFLTPKQVKKVSNDGMEREECDLVTGESVSYTHLRAHET